MSDPLKDVIAEMPEVVRRSRRQAADLSALGQVAPAVFLKQTAAQIERWLAALASSLSQERDEREDTRVDGVPEGAHGDLPRHTTR